MVAIAVDDEDNDKRMNARISQPPRAGRPRLENHFITPLLLSISQTLKVYMNRQKK
jgi:hypothetical protein